ncbi:hypothetical protein HanPI659440_Chr15g0603961 [Helianthus annuus]|nr:hypothetical protein HanPI659440_Chr15g0603921 [Helianthus annuus]KAJ0694017.1 hypothetical protein HanPI659440_Chr15g0603961 [Helianthus annuus]
MGRGLGRGWTENVQAITPGGLGFRRGLSLKPGVGRVYQYDMTGSRWPNQTSRWLTAMLKKYLFFHYKTHTSIPFFTTLNHNTLHIFYNHLYSHSTKQKMHPHNRGYDPNNPWAFQENPSPPPNRPMPRPFLIHSSMPDMAGYASSLGNRLYTNFPHTDDSISSPIPQTPINLSPTSINLSQNETVPETQPPNDGPSASKPIKKRSYKKKNRGGEST